MAIARNCCRKSFGSLCVAAAVLLVLGGVARAQEPPEPEDMTITAETRAAMIHTAAKLLRDHYVFPDLGEKMSRSLEQQHKRGQFAKITSAKEFARVVTENLRAISHDVHLRVIYTAQESAAQSPAASPAAGDPAARIARVRFSNVGFRNADRLDGNVGYLRLDVFGPTMVGSGEKLKAAMQFLHHTDALIVDLRNNGGGSPDLSSLFISYFFDGDPFLISSVHWRDKSQPNGERVQELKTTKLPDTDRYGANKPVFVLTSHDSYSAAEEVSYELQGFKRATIVGETTGGGAHAGDVMPLAPHFGLWVPTGRGVSAATQSNWEAVGVKPDVAVPADQAFSKAYELALQAVLQKTTDPERKQLLKAAFESRRQVQR